MDGSSCAETPAARKLAKGWDNATDPRHPHQMWLKAKRDDRPSNFAAFRAACPSLSDELCSDVVSMHDSAQYEFIKGLLWDRSFGTFDDGNYITIEAAYAGAVEEQLKVDPAVQERVRKVAKAFGTKVPNRLCTQVEVEMWMQSIIAEKTRRQLTSALLMLLAGCGPKRSPEFQLVNQQTAGQLVDSLTRYIILGTVWKRALQVGVEA